jgi:hypothetical protein
MIDYIVENTRQKTQQSKNKALKKQPEKIEIKKQKQRKQTQKPIRPNRQ